MYSLTIRCVTTFSHFHSHYPFSLSLSLSETFLSKKDAFLLSFFKDFILYVVMHACLYLYGVCEKECSACRGQKRESHPLKEVFKTVVRGQVVMKTKFGSSAKPFNL